MANWCNKDVSELEGLSNDSKQLMSCIQPSYISIESFLHFCSDLQVMCVLEFSTGACNETGKTAYSTARFEIDFAMVGRRLSLIPTVIKIMLTKIQLVVAYLYSNSFGMFSL